MNKEIKSIGMVERNVYEKPELIMVSRNDNYSFTNEWYEIALEDHFWMQWRFFVFKNLLKKAEISLKHQLNVLEIGCGKGVFLKQMEQNSFWNIDGADINWEALNDSVAKRSRLLFYNIMEKRSEYKHAYDMVILMDVLEHIEKPGEFLEACFFHIRPGGIFIINTPALPSMYSVYDERMGHFRRYNNKKLLQEFEIVEIDKVVTIHWGFTLLPFLFLRKLLISKDAKRKDIVKKGFAPPGRLSHTVLKFFMRLELLFFKNLPIGTSIMNAVFITKD